MKAKKKTKKGKQKHPNNQEQVFVDEYLVCLNPEKAALKAKYAKTTARTKSFLWVSDSKQNPKPYIYKIIKKRMAARSEKTGIKAEQVIQEFAKIAFSNIQDYIGPDNEITDISEMNKEIAAAVESVQTTSTITSNSKDDKEYETKNIKLKLHNKISALENLGKHLGIYAENNKLLVEFLPPVIR